MIYMETKEWIEKTAKKLNASKVEVLDCLYFTSMMAKGMTIDETNKFLGVDYYKLKAEYEVI